MRKTFKYRLLANKQVFEKVDNWLNLCRNLYNVALEQRILIYRQNKGSISYYAQKRQLPELKMACPEYKIIDAQTLQEVLQRLNRTYQAFFRHVKNGNSRVGFPRFKGENRYNSFTLWTQGWKLDGKYLSIRNLGRFKLRLSRQIEGDIKTITICRSPTNKWYACFSCDNVPERKLSKSTNIVGLDMGIKSFLVDSNGNKVDNPQYLRQSEKLLRLRQRRLCRRVKGSNRRQKARILVAKTHEKIYSQRLDFLHKLANSYIKDYGVLVFEDLNINGMVKNHHWAKSINDCSWGEFIRLVSYKAEEAGRTVIKIPRFEPTSKTCSECGAINQELTLNDRQWVCKSCGILHDRDYNAAKNIRRVGQTLQEQTYANR